jgi:hypothetical protein
LDEDKFKEVSNIIDKFYRVLLEKHNLVLDESLYSFVNLKNRNSKKLNIKNHIKLQDIYFNYDFKKNEDSQEYFNKFLDSYLTNV